MVLPQKQGLRHCNYLDNHNTQNQVRMVLPQKQGLRRATSYDVVRYNPGQNGTSTKTRIKTII